MNTGFGTNLEGFIIEGNLSLNKAPLPGIDGDGSLEASGTIYIDTIREYSQTGGVTIQDVVFQNQTITVPYTQPSISLTTASLLIDGGIYIRNTTNSTSLTSGGGISVLGGASFNKDVHIGGITNVYDNRIINVQWPILGGDAANKDYVDSKTFGSSVTGNFTQGQVLIGGTGGNIEGYDSFLFNGQNLTLTTPLIINNTTLGLNDTSGALIVYGGGYFGNYTTINNVLNMNNNNIQNVLDPILDQDAATKKYVDDYGINDNFTKGQLIIGDSNGNDIRGYDNLFFDIPDGTTGTVIFNQNTSLTLANSTDSTGLGSGGTLNISGGVSILGKTYLGDELDMGLKNIRNLQDPVLDYDAVNKRYFDNYYLDADTLILDTTNTPIDIPALTFTSDIKAFISYVYVHNQTACSYYTIRGINRDSNWYIQKTFIGEPTNIDFNIRFDSGSGIVQYINNNQQDNLTTIRFNNPIIIYDLPDLDQINTSINGNVNSFTDIPDLTFDNNVYDAVKIAVYISNSSQNIYGLIYLNCVLQNTSWILSSYLFGDLTGVSFDITNYLTTGIIRYTNSSSNTYDLRIEIVDILKSQYLLTLPGNTLSFTEIPELVIDNALCIYNISLFIFNTLDNKYALYDLEGFICDNQWNINNRYIGDDLLIQFSANYNSQNGVVTFKNNSPNDAYIRYKITSPTLVYPPLPVNKGGTGENYHAQYAILRGNGVDPLIGTTDFIYQDRTLTLGNSSRILLNNTDNSTGYTSGGVFTNLGGGSFSKDLYVGGSIYVNSNNIHDVLDPVLDQDAATKKYVDDNSITGNFTSGQLIVADSNGDAIRGYNNLTFDIPDGTHGSVLLNQNTNLTLTNSTDAIGLGSGGTMNISGGVSILGKTYLGDELDVNLKNIKNVKTPEVDYDAVNKKYVDDLFKDVDYTQLPNNTLLPVDIPDFSFSNDIRAFIAYIYVQYNHVDCSRVTVRGINRGTSWYIQKTFVGEPTNIDFYITNSGNMQYTNSNSSGISSIRFKTLTLIYNDPIADQINLTLNNNIVTHTDIPELTFLNSEYDSAKVILYVSNDTSNNYGLVFLNCLLKNNQWIINPYTFGNISGINFSINNLVNSGVISYINTNLTGSWDIRCEVIKILKTDSQLTLLNNTVSYTSIPELTFENSQYVFLLTAFVSIPDNNQYAMYEIEGLNCNGEWHINTRFIGDLLDIHFNITTIDNIGYLQYINGTSYNAYIKSVLNTPMAFDSLPVNRGGIGTNYLQPHTILRGNGIDPIIGTNDFIYKDLVLTLGNGSSILLNNITNSSGYTSGGVFTNLGGGCFSKDLYIGQNLFIANDISVNDIYITPSVGDLTKEQLYMGNNNVINESITGLLFSNPVIKSFNGTLCITVSTSTPSQLDALYTIKTLKKSTGWIIDYSFIGDILGITLDIDNSGQVTYSSPLIINWLSTEIHFRGLTTTI
jgi:hypothetical protein